MLININTSTYIYVHTCIYIHIALTLSLVYEQANNIPGPDLQIWVLLKGFSTHSRPGKSPVLQSEAPAQTPPVCTCAGRLSMSPFLRGNGPASLMRKLSPSYFRSFMTLNSHEHNSRSSCSVNTFANCWICHQLLVNLISVSVYMQYVSSGVFAICIVWSWRAIFIVWCIPIYKRNYKYTYIHKHHHADTTPGPSRFSRQDMKSLSHIRWIEISF